MFNFQIFRMCMNTVYLKKTPSCKLDRILKNKYFKLYFKIQFHNHVEE